MLIKNGKVVFEYGVKFCDIRIEDEIIKELGCGLTPLEGEEVLDFAKGYILAGFIDTHTHGAANQSYSNPDADLKAISDYEVSCGVTAVLPTISSYKFDSLKPCAENILNYIKRQEVGTKFVGIHSEGPFLNPTKKGGMIEEFIAKPTKEAFLELYDILGGLLKIITIAPEMDDNFEVISLAASMGVKVSAGHTMATYEQMQKAVNKGVTRMTHTFNACAPFSHREPGVLGAAFIDPRVTCEAICDFVHIHHTAVELIYKLKGASNFTAISDSLYCAGVPDGLYIVDGREQTVSGGVARLSDGTLSGSANSLLYGFYNLKKLNIPLNEITQMVSSNPAKAAGIYDETGSIEVGKKADLVLFDTDWKIHSTFVNGQCVYKTLE